MILRQTPGTIGVTFLDGDVPADPGAVTIGITRANGATLVGVPPGTATFGTGTDERTFQLTTTHTATVDILKATWTSPTHGVAPTWHPIVGGFYFDLETLRNAGDLSDQAKFPDAALADARWWWTDLVDGYCEQSFVPVYRLEERWHTTGDLIWLDRPHVRTILHATLDGATLDTTGWKASPSGRIFLAGGNTPAVSTGLLQVGYEHGLDRVPRDLYPAGLVACRDHLLSNRSGRPSRMTLISNDLGTVRLSQPGTARATGIPDVDGPLNRHVAEPIAVA